MADAEENERDQILWRELEDGFHKRRWFVASRGLLAIGEEAEGEDEDENEPEEREHLVVLADQLWRAIASAGLTGAFLIACENHERDVLTFSRWRFVCDLSMVDRWLDWQSLLQDFQKPPERSQ